MPADVPNDKWEYMDWNYGSKREDWRTISTGDILVNVTGSGMSFNTNQILYFSYFALWLFFETYMMKISNFYFVIFYIRKLWRLFHHQN